MLKIVPYVCKNMEQLKKEGISRALLYALL